MLDHIQDAKTQSGTLSILQSLIQDMSLICNFKIDKDIQNSGYEFIKDQ